MSQNNSAASVTVGDEGDGIPVSIVVSPHSKRRRGGSRKSAAEIVAPLAVPPTPPVAIPSAPVVQASLPPVAPLPLLDTSTFTADTHVEPQTSRQPAAPPSSPSD